MSRSVALVTDSTSLDAESARRLGVVVVPLQVVIGTTSYDEGTELQPEAVAAALRSHTAVSTSRPAPESFLRVYEQAAARGMSAVVSVHLSEEVSGTFESARLAARDASIPVIRWTAANWGWVRASPWSRPRECSTPERTRPAAARCARDRAAATTALFYVDTLEYLRRGGRVGAAAAFVGSALAVKPLLRILDGRSRRWRRSARLQRPSRAWRSWRYTRRVPSASTLPCPTSPMPTGRSCSRPGSRQRVPNVAELVVTEVGCGHRCARGSGNAGRGRLAA